MVRQFEARPRACGGGSLIVQAAACGLVYLLIQGSVGPGRPPPHHFDERDEEGGGCCRYREYWNGESARRGVVAGERAGVRRVNLESSVRWIIRESYKIIQSLETHDSQM